MRVDLVVSTLDRPRELRALLASLAGQTRGPDRVIVVDQGDDRRSEAVVGDFSAVLDILYIRQDRRGLSRGRNAGLPHSDGDIVGFPDDDCTYPPDAVERIVAAFEGDGELGVLTGMSVSDAGAPSQGRWSATPHPIDRYNIWVSQTSYTTFYRRTALRGVGGFEETLGVGSGTKWGAGEETDLMLRALRAGVKGSYRPDLRIVHAEPIRSYDGAALSRGTRYNRGFGRVLSRNAYPAWFVAYMVARPAAGVLASLLAGRFGEARYRSIASSQRLLGWMDR